ncbi:hypothetical protein AW736_26630 [Termitidicoccus mucosus]|uniref:TonB-dependent receptor n=1 Tax=Termitidicoccus mucosus TaxID=1184151 RepID=A0A178IKU3_9BACT|nr:hypothetical protein AW736_08275 [Opitutaceae bacterium TSB47]OAM91838.1 hypothetical protein AW736_26630 [Opitutaceae bacterium TSB47]
MLSIPLILFTSALSAQTIVPAPTGESDGEIVRLDRYKVVGDNALGIGDITLQSTGLPASVSIIDHDSLERTNFTGDFGGLLRRVPGIMAHNLNQGDTGTSIKMRGFLTRTHGADVAVYVDGIAQNLPSSALSDGMNDLSWLTPEMIERIEVIKGPFSALYGNQNRAGAVNIVTRSVAPDASARVDAGSHGYLHGALTASGQTRGVQGLFAADARHSDGYRDHADSDRLSLFGKTSILHADGVWAARAAFQRAYWNASGMLRLGDLRSGAVSARDRDPYTAPAWGEATRASLVFTRAPARSEEGWNASLGYEYYERTRAVGATATNLNVLYDRRDILGARALRNFLVGNRGSLTVGLEGRYDRGDAESRLWSDNVPTTNYAFNYDLDLLAYGAFVQAQWKLANALKLVGGIRADGFDYDIGNRRQPDASATYSRPVFTPRIGLVLTPASRLEIFANYGQGFRPPASNELSPYSGTGPLDAPGGASVSGLESSTVGSFDLGLRFGFAPGWRFSVEGYHTENDDETTQVSPGVYENVGETTRDGWEVQLEWLPAKNLSLYAGYARIVRARIDTAAPGTADRLSVPGDTWKAGLAYTLTLAETRLILLNADAYYISGIPYFLSGVLHHARPYARYDFRAAYEMKRWQFTLGLTWQPIKNSSEVAYASGGDLALDPRPECEVIAGVRFAF